jgi:hypothetical protein
MFAFFGPMYAGSLTGVSAVTSHDIIQIQLIPLPVEPFLLQYLLAPCPTSISTTPT